MPQEGGVEVRRNGLNVDVAAAEILNDVRLFPF